MNNSDKFDEIIAHLESKKTELSVAGIRQLKKAIEKPIQSKLMEQYLPKDINETPYFYVPLLPVDNYRGRRPNHILQMYDDGIGQTEMLNKSPYWMLPLLFPVQDEKFGRYDDGTPMWEPAKDRLINPGFTGFTYEMDGPDLSAFEEQLGWLNGSNGKIVQLDKCLKEFKDYRGIEVVWSGNKSLHIHVSFDTQHMIDDPKQPRKVCEKFQFELPEGYYKDYITQAWHKLNSKMERFLEPSIAFDTSAASPVQLRRTPWGLREAKDGNLLGFAEGTLIPQAVLFSSIRERSPRSASGWFLDEQLLKETAMTRSSSSKTTQCRLVEDKEQKPLLDAFGELLRNHWGSEYPKPASLSSGDGLNEVRFQNHPGDKNPSSVITGPHRSVLLYGRNAPVGKFSLPDGYTLDETLDMLRSEIDSTQLKKPVINASFFENRFYEWVQKNISAGSEIKTSAMSAIGTVLQFMTGVGGLNWIKSIEGIGKTHGLLKRLPEIHYEVWIDVRNGYYVKGQKLGYLLFACRSYSQAQEKCDEFNRIHGPDGLFRGIVIKSFSQIYKEVYQQVEGLKPTRPFIDLGYAAKQGYSNLHDAVESLQPDIYQLMCEKRDQMWAEAGSLGENGLPHPSRTVLFTAQGVIQHWHIPSKSRLWLNPGFDSNLEQEGLLGLDEEPLDQVDEGSSEDTEPHVWYRDLSLSHVVYDEVSMDALVEEIDEKEFRFIQNVEKQIKNWSEAGLLKQYKAYERVRNRCKDEEILEKLSFERVRGLIGAKISEEHEVTVNTELDPFGVGNDDDNVYASCHGQSYYIVKRPWWISLGARITVLTTEEFPTQVAEKTLVKHGFRIHRLDRADTFMNELIPVRLDKRASKRGRDELVDELIQKQPSLTVIADGFPLDHPNVINHQRARGRNDLSGTEIATIIQFLNPQQYAEILALAQKFGIDDPVRTHYLDQIGQAAGRNRGMRAKSPKPFDHVVIMSPRLFKELGYNQLWSDFRYQMYRTN